MSVRSMIDIHVRLPEDLHALLVAKAKQERRSLNSQMILMLEAVLKERS